MSQLLSVTAGAYWSGYTPPLPPRAELMRLLAVLDAQVDALGLTLDAGTLRPVAVIGAQTWRLSPGSDRPFYSEVRIEVAPGKPDRPLQSWWQWQHVRFSWSTRQAPVDVVLKAGGVA